jgi:hypothetical protein
MLTVYNASSQKSLDQFISNTMNNWAGWAFAQPDIGRVTFPAQFVIVHDYSIKLAAIQVLQ